jgi:DNA (cytosine-5)-methyltransferase 1
MNTFYEFFAGGGMARAGLGEGWECLFANDFDLKKGDTYRNNWGENELRVQDIGHVQTKQLPGTADLAWASFPCQDLSLAGGGAGLRGERSDTFRPFWKLMTRLIAESRGPRMIVLENVCGALTSHGGKDFATLCESLSMANYAVGAIIVDAALFLPQSRPRLFIIGVRKDLSIPQDIQSDIIVSPWHTSALIRAYQGLSNEVKASWIWWKLPRPLTRKKGLRDMLDRIQDSPEWFSEQDTQRLLDMMSNINRAKVDKALKYGKRIVGSVYKRTRIGSDGGKLQRAEIRFDDMSGCLRTPAGGSSRQIVVVVEDNKVRARLISARETARLMGLPENYKLPQNYNEAYHLTGDGVVVPVVRHVAESILEPIMKAARRSTSVTAA